MQGVSAILIAAGESSRMGYPKPLMLWNGRTLLEHQICSLTQAGVAEVVVVLGHQADVISPYARGAKVRWVKNRDYRLGKTTSIKAGLQHIDPAAKGILLLAVDQPRTASIVSRIIQSHLDSDALITSPRFQGHGGHPLVFSASLKPELERLSEDREGIREVFQAHRERVLEVAFEDSLVCLDLNTQKDYKEARAIYGS